MHTTDLLTVGEVSRRSGFAPSALRYYERQGLITATRTGGGQRRYERSVLRRLAFIRAARNVGLSPGRGRRGARRRCPTRRTPTRADWTRLSRGLAGAARRADRGARGAARRAGLVHRLRLPVAAHAARSPTRRPGGRSAVPARRSSPARSAASGTPGDIASATPGDGPHRRCTLDGRPLVTQREQISPWRPSSRGGSHGYVRYMRAPDSLELRRLALAVSVLDDVDIVPLDDGLLLSGVTPVEVSWRELRRALAGADPDGRRRAGPRPRLAARPPDRRGHPSRRAASDLARPVGLPVDHPLYPGLDWVRHRVLGDASTSASASSGSAPTRTRSSSCRRVPSMRRASTRRRGGPRRSTTWSGWVPSPRSACRDDPTLRPIGDCDVVTLLGSQHLAHGPWRPGRDRHARGRRPDAPTRVAGPHPHRPGLHSGGRRRHRRRRSAGSRGRCCSLPTRSRWRSTVAGRPRSCCATRRSSRRTCGRCSSADRVGPGTRQDGARGPRRDALCAPPSLLSEHGIAHFDGPGGSQAPRRWPMRSPGRWSPALPTAGRSRPPSSGPTTWSCGARGRSPTCSAPTPAAWCSAAR